MDFLQEELDEILNIFSQESSEILQSMDKNLLLLEKKPHNQDVAMHLFRDAHSLKGSARMLGFVDIQNIAHKIEDVLGLIREEKIQANQEITDSISAALSCIDTLIKKTIEQKSEFKSPEGEMHIKKLNEICENSGNIPSKKANEEQSGFLRINFEKFEDLITGIIFIFSKSVHENNFEQFTDIITMLGELSHLCEGLNNKEIYDTALNMLDLAAKIVKEENRNEETIYELNIKINEFIQSFNALARENGLNSKNYYESAYKISSDNKLVEPDDKTGDQIPDLKGAELLELINKTISTIPDIGKNRHSLAEIKSLLNEIVSRLNNSDFKKIYNSVLTVILNFEKNNSKCEDDSIDAIKEILESTAGIVEAKANKDTYNDFTEEIDFLKQKAAIVEQMVRFELQSPNKMQKTQRSPRTMDWAQSFDTNTIKTLRVNSDKLDKLVNQIGNLIVTRIKSHENIGIAKVIQDELLELQKHYHKIGYYMKFYEKKYVQEYPENQNKGKFQKKDAFLGYNKQLISFHNANSERMAHILNHLNLLTKEMQENNIKLNTTTSEIENMVKSMRILPLSTVFNLFPRMVHNIAHDKGKEIELIIEGQEVSADKKIIEDIKIPIMHIVRNSIDHGIELPKERERLGKNRSGVIIIKASQRENKIVVSIKDDGHGINIEKIKAKAIEKGLITREAAFNMSKEQLANFIFYPGFSTGDTVTELSGRGFGLDIVHTKISQLNGRIDVYSEENKGTIVTMELPTTMATMKAFIIKEDDRLFALAAANIQTVLRITPDEIKKRDEKYYFIYDNQAIPVCSLVSILNIKRENKPVDKYTMMIIKAENVTLGIIVQKLIGDEEILNKKLPEPMLHVKNISGIATLANGEMCLLLNIGDILNSGKIVSRDFNTTKSLTLQDNSKYKILVVDDSVTTRRLLTNVLSSKGYNVETESNAKSALDSLEPNNYDLIISDYEMPNMNGLDFLKIIHSKEKTKDIPVFVLTSVDKPGLKEEFLNNGACEFIKKEYFDQQNFVKLIDKYLNISLQEK